MEDENIEDENICTILKNSHVNFLIGAGASVNLVTNLQSYPLMSVLLETVKTDPDILKFYSKLQKHSFDTTAQYGILTSLFDKYLFSDNANVETFLSVLEGVDLYISDAPLHTKVKNIQCIVRKIILNRIKSSDDETVITIYKKFYNGIRHLKEISSFENQAFNIFTTNYDMLNESAMESLGVHYYAGFDGIMDRRFNMSYYNYEYVNNYNINKNKYLINTNHINLYKLHGSISWKYDTDLRELNPYENDFLPEIIYPSVAKFENINLIADYSALMREFTNQISQEDSSLFVTGTSLGDEHINKIIENALTINTFTLVVFAYSDELIKIQKTKYKDCPNVIVYNDPTSFSDFGDILFKLSGKENDE